MPEVTIKFDPQTKNISVSVPSDNLLALGMLEFAKIYVASKIEFGGDSPIVLFKGNLPKGPQ